MPNWRHSTAIFSPSSSRAMNFSRSSAWLHSFQGTFAFLAKGPVCNHVSGMNCHHSLRKGTRSDALAGVSERCKEF
jgi:hypothetical protein